MKARRAVVVVSAAQHSRVHRCWHLLIQTLHCGWRVLHCGRRVLHCGRRRSIEIGMLVHKDLHCWSVLRIFTNQGKVSSNIFVNIKIFLRNLRKYLIIYPLDKNPWFGPLCNVAQSTVYPNLDNQNQLLICAVVRVRQRTGGHKQYNVWFHISSPSRLIRAAASCPPGVRQIGLNNSAAARQRRGWGWGWGR